MPPLPSSARRASRWRSEMGRDQVLASAIGVVLLACSALLRGITYNTVTLTPATATSPAIEDSQRHNWPGWGLEGRRASLVREDPESEKRLSSLAVTFPRLTFGGMRGVASTYLWMQAEEDKNDRKWVDLETKYDLIGALQPYFASVYVFHSWNQAYNLSAQWQEVEIKYKWVLDGIAYLYKGEDFNPANPDIQFEEAQLYAQKLGLASERLNYRAHWRSDISRLHELNTKPGTDKDATVALQLVRQFVTRRDPRDLATARSYFHTEELPDPAHPGGIATGWGLRIYPDIDAEKNFNLFKDRGDGKLPTEPMDFRYGLSPFYFAYIEYKRCLALPVGPTYTATRVVESWPAMSLRLWCRDDLQYIDASMLRLFGPDADKALLANGATVSEKTAELHDCFRNIQMIAPRAAELFDQTIARNNSGNIHIKHKFETLADKEIAKAEIRLFDALIEWQNNGRRLDGDKGQAVVRSLKEADQLYKDAYIPTMAWVDNMYPRIEGQPDNNPDRYDYERYANALQVRSKGIEAMLTLPAGQEPDMSFLAEKVVED